MQPFEFTIGQVIFGYIGGHMNALQTVTELNNLHQAMGKALTEPQQLFVSANWPELAQWLATDLGKLALQSFINDWQESRKPALRGLSNVKTR